MTRRVRYRCSGGGKQVAVAAAVAQERRSDSLAKCSTRVQTDARYAYVHTFRGRAFRPFRPALAPLRCPVCAGWVVTYLPPTRSTNYAMQASGGRSSSRRRRRRRRPPGGANPACTPFMSSRGPAQRSRALPAGWQPGVAAACESASCCRSHAAAALPVAPAGTSDLYLNQARQTFTSETHAELAQQGTSLSMHRQL